MVTRNKVSVKPLVKSTIKPSPITPQIKLKRDRFTMPINEYQILGEIKKLLLQSGVKVKKSDLLRVGLSLVGELDFSVLKRAVAGLAPIDRSKEK